MIISAHHMELQHERDHKGPALGLEDRLGDDVARRAASLDLELHSYLRGLHLEDRTLEFDRAIIATIVAWFPVLALLVALAFTEQGQDLLAELGGNSAAIFFGMLAILDVVSTIFSTNLITAWFFPRIAQAANGGGLFWPRIPQDLEPLNKGEFREARAWTILPVIISIALPLTILSSAAIGQSGWLATALWLGLFALFGGITLLTVFVATRFALQAVWLSRVLLFVGLIGAAALGTFAVPVTARIGTPTVAVAAAIIWSLIFHGAAFLFFLPRYAHAWARLVASSIRHPRLQKVAYGAIPHVIKRHAGLVLIGGVIAFIFWLVPVSQVWMTANDGRLAAESPRAAGASDKPVPAKSLESAFGDFANALPNGRPSLVLVTAAGGGIRAAYWSGAVLSALQDKEPTFKDRVLAISAVSGGALGAATYKALTLRDEMKCKSGSNNRECAAAFLSGDFVGPNIFSAVSGEVFQWFMRGRAPVAARDENLQLAWSLRWLEVSGGLAPSFSGDFDALFEQHPTPALLLNGTSMVTGRRTITSNIDVGSLLADQNPENKECPSESGILNPAQHIKLSVSAAVLTSARFPYVTPPGLLHLLAPPPKDIPTKEDKVGPAEEEKARAKVECRTWDEIVDGGYVDNEGVITMRDVLNRLIKQMPAAKDKTQAQTFAAKYRIVVIRLSTQPSPPDPALSKTPPPRDQLNQLYVAFSNQLAASGRDLVREFRNQITELKGCWIEFNALHDDAPLGWSLSTRARNRLDAWLDGPKSAAWANLKLDSDNPAHQRVTALAHDVDLPKRLNLVRDLVKGQNVSCDLKDRFN